MRRCPERPACLLVTKDTPRTGYIGNSVSFQSRLWTIFLLGWYVVEIVILCCWKTYEEKKPSHEVQRREKKNQTLRLWINPLTAGVELEVVVVESLSRVRLLHPHGLEPARLLIFPGKNTGVGYHFLLQGIFPTQESNLGHTLKHMHLLRKISQNIPISKLGIREIEIERGWERKYIGEVRVWTLESPLINLAKLHNSFCFNFLIYKNMIR